MKSGKKKKLRLVWRILFLLYILLLIYFLFFAEWYGRGQSVQTELHYNFVPLLEIRRFWTYRETLGFWPVFLNLACNVIGFIPFGFILPILARSMRKGIGVVMFGCILSVFIECMQLILKVGCCDVDDVILNTVGVAVGYIMFLVCDCIRRLVNGKKTKV